jgi:hypothetical protein
MGVLTSVVFPWRHDPKLHEQRSILIHAYGQAEFIRLSTVGEPVLSFFILLPDNRKLCVRFWALG